MFALYFMDARSIPFLLDNSSCNFVTPYPPDCVLKRLLGKFAFNYMNVVVLKVGSHRYASIFLCARTQSVQSDLKSEIFEGQNCLKSCWQ